MFNFVCFFMPSSLPLLHPYIFLKEIMWFFLSCFCDFFWSLNFSQDRQLHAAASNGELGWIRLASATCGVNKSAPEGSLWRTTSLVPRKKAWERGDTAVPRVATFAQAHDNLHSGLSRFPGIQETKTLSGPLTSDNPTTDSFGKCVSDANKRLPSFVES